MSADKQPMVLLHVRVEPAVNKAITELVDHDEQRDASKVLRLLIHQALRARGLWPPKE